MHVYEPDLIILFPKLKGTGPQAKDGQNVKFGYENTY